MKTKRSFVFLCVFVLSFLGCHQESRYTDLNGHTIRFSDFRNRWLLINYWAYWCEPCHQEIPELNAFSKKEHIALLGVSYDQASPAQLKKWATQLGIQFPVLTSDPAPTLGIDPIPGLPTTVLINPDGKVKQYLFGPQTEKSLYQALHH
jgi:thiol-disulfide isomerase/thioredoxin